MTLPPARPPLSREGRLVLWIAILASFVAFLDGTVVNVALPAIENELGGGLVTQQWVVDAYLITLGALILVAGSLSDVFGRIVVIRVGLIGFGLTSVAVGLAPTALTMILARGAQGIAGAMLVPSSLALITSTFGGRAQSRAIGTWTGATTTAMVVGPVLGGALVDLASWRLVFLINVVPIAITLGLLHRLARTGRRDRRDPAARVDWPSAALCTIGLSGVVFALIEQGRLGWSAATIWGPFAVGAICLGVFLARQRRLPQPMMPLTLFRVRNFSHGNLATTFVYAALGLYGLVVAVYLQQGAGMPATVAGLVLLPPTILMILGSSRVGDRAGRVGPRAFMTAGPIVMAAGALGLLRVADSFDLWTQVLPSVVVFGIGLTLTVAPLTSAVLGSIEPARAGIASAINNAIARVAGLLAVAALGPITGGVLDLGGFHRVAVVVAVLLALGGLASYAGIRNPSAPEPG
ncbi:MFS transporter [Pseudactinotalea sp. HY158]|uniref:MFS transporter n=1 Tax=Pseudactinotalea sp. HY158 TaxID=2654547 RepID=UPI00129CC959|nr:MFS transporter [Pseudactinotalea sp. HY158]QGH69818.1 MFS transporter [Pseudactinotalea sp. HY158]